MEKLANKLFAYIVPHDTGFAPCVCNNICTFATCKPNIRKRFKGENDKDNVWIIGFSSLNQPFKGCRRIIYIMKVSKVITYKDYFTNFNKERKDCIYCAAVQDNKTYQYKNFIQKDQYSTHGWKCDGGKAMRNDIDGLNVLYSNHFVYFGGSTEYILDKCGQIDVNNYTFKLSEVASRLNKSPRHYFESRFDHDENRTFDEFIMLKDYIINERKQIGVIEYPSCYKDICKNCDISKKCDYVNKGCML